MAKYSIEKAELVRESDPTVWEQIEQAEKDIDEVRINFRWGKEQLALVKEAARLQGLPYQIYIRKALYDRAAADIAAHHQLEAVRQRQ